GVGRGPGVTARRQAHALDAAPALRARARTPREVDRREHAARQPQRRERRERHTRSHLRRSIPAAFLVGERPADSVPAMTRHAVLPVALAGILAGCMMIDSISPAVRL